MSGHTPGPWAVYGSGPVMHSYEQPFAIAQAGNTNLIAGAFADVRGGADVGEANARLIAAAPDLLEAAQHVMRFGGMLPEVTEPLLAAIAKATTGEQK